MIADTSTQDRILDRPSFMARFGWKLSLVLVLLLGGFFFYPKLSRYFSTQRSVPGERLRTALVSRGALIRDLSVEGRIVASSYPTVFSPDQGKVTVFVRPGETVEKGQLVARIESPELRNRLAQEQSVLEALEAELARKKILIKTTTLQSERENGLRKLRLEAARRSFSRAKKSRDMGLINEEEYEKTADEVKISELEFTNGVEATKLEKETLEFEIQNQLAQVERQKLVLQELGRRVQDLEVNAPVDGMVGNLGVDQSDWVAVNQPILTVIDLSAFEIELDIPEGYADEIGPGAQAEVTYMGQLYPGTVAHIAPEVENSVVKGTVVFGAQTPSGLKQNQRVFTRIFLDQHENVVKVKRGAFLENFGGQQIYRVQGDIAELIPINTGTSSVLEVEILRGLSPGDEVIISDMSQFDQANRLLIRR